MHISAPNNCPHRMFDTPHVHTVELERETHQVMKSSQDSKVLSISTLSPSSEQRPSSWHSLRGRPPERDNRLALPKGT